MAVGGLGAPQIFSIPTGQNRTRRSHCKRPRAKVSLDFLLSTSARTMSRINKNGGWRSGPRMSRRGKRAEQNTFQCRTKCWPFSEFSETREFLTTARVSPGWGQRPPPYVSGHRYKSVERSRNFVLDRARVSASPDQPVPGKKISSTKFFG